MENQVDLEKEVWKEADLMTALGLTRTQLDHLRLNKDFPCVRLGQRSRVYLASEVLNYLKGIAERR